MQEELLSKLKTASWRQASCRLSEVTTVTNKITKTDGSINPETGKISNSTYVAYLDDRFDAFKQGGDGDITEGTMCGYAGLAAYRYELPSDGLGGISLTDVSVPVQSSRYLRSGLRVVVALSGSENALPPSGWDIIRGTGGVGTASEGFTVVAVSDSESESGVTGVSSWGLCAQREAAYLLQSMPIYVTKAKSGLSDSVALSKYLWIFVSVEDYVDYWDIYDEEGEPRYYSIEGSATVVYPKVVFTFSGAVEDTDPEYATRSPSGDTRIIPAGQVGEIPYYPFFYSFGTGVTKSIVNDGKDRIFAYYRYPVIYSVGFLLNGDEIKYEYDEDSSYPVCSEQFSGRTYIHHCFYKGNLCKANPHVPPHALTDESLNKSFVTQFPYSHGGIPPGKYKKGESVIFYPDPISPIPLYSYILN